MIKPTNGRVVLYHPPAGSAVAVHGRDGLAAQIAHVWTDTCINIGYLDSNGHHHNATAVFLWNGEGTPPDSSYAEWMPYQLASQTGPARDLPANAPKTVAA